MSATSGRENSCGGRSPARSISRTFVPERETRSSSLWGHVFGDAIPSHLRAGIYQDEGYSCPLSGPGCSIDIDNVQVLSAPAPVP